MNNEPPDDKPAVSGSAVLNYASPKFEQLDVSTSQLGVSSLVSGLLLCVPFVTGVLAIMLGIGAIRTEHRLIQRAFGIAGIALGTLNLLIWVSGSLISLWR
jgi:hypothetical protein